MHPEESNKASKGAKRHVLQGMAKGLVSLEKRRWEGGLIAVNCFLRSQTEMVLGSNSWYLMTAYVVIWLKTRLETFTESWTLKNS